MIKTFFLVCFFICLVGPLEVCSQEDPYAGKRDQMVKYQIESRGIKNPAVLKAMRDVPRHLFVPAEMKMLSYGDFPFPIGKGQTISQPYIVALMTELLDLKPNDKVLEIGTGSGYQAAVLGEIAKEVYSVEIVESLAESSKKKLEEMGYDNIHVKYGDGYRGWPEYAPFDAIIITAAPPKIPEPLIEQLKVGGRMVLPLGRWSQDLIVIEKDKKGISKKSIIPVRFVPMTGEVQK